MQATPNQSAADLQSLFGSPGLLTSGIPLILEDVGGGTSAYVPLPGGAYPNPDGPLINPHDRCGSARQRSGTASPGGRPGGPGLEPSAAAQDRLSGAQPHPPHRPAALSLLPGWSSDQKPVDSAAGLRQYTDNV